MIRSLSDHRTEARQRSGFMPNCNFVGRPTSCPSVGYKRHQLKVVELEGCVRFVYKFEMRHGQAGEGTGDSASAQDS